MIAHILTFGDFFVVFGLLPLDKMPPFLIYVDLKEKAANDERYTRKYGRGGLEYHPACFRGTLDLTDVNRSAIFPYHRPHGHQISAIRVPFGISIRAPLGL